MSEQVIIPFHLEGAPESVRRAMALADALEKVARQSDRAESAIRATNRAAARAAAVWDRATKAAGAYAATIATINGGGSPSTPAISTGSGSGPRLPPRVRPLSGPAQGLIRAQSNFQNFGNGPDPAAAFDAQQALTNAQNRMIRAQRGPSSPIANLIKSTRIGVGGAGGAMPLVGQIANTLGPEATAAIAAIKIGAEFVEHALERGAAKIHLAFGSGSLDSANRLGGVAAGLGFDPNSAEGFVSRNSEGPGSYYLRKANVSPYASAYGGGNTDDAKSLVNFLKHYSDPNRSTDIDARMAGRATGQSDNIALARAASPEVRAKLFETKDDALKPETLRAAADAQIKLNLAHEDFEKVGDRIATAVLPPLVDALEALEPVIQTTAMEIDFLVQSMETQAIMAKRVGMTLWDLANMRFDKVAQDIKYLTDPIKTSNRAHEQAADKMNQAADKMQDAANQWKDGSYGRGAARANAAVPGIGANYDNAAHREAAASGSVVF